MSTVIEIENLSKYYRLGVIGGQTLREDVNRWLAKLRGRPDPLLKVDEIDHGNRENRLIWALKNVNLEVKEGEILGIIGRNGAGKSTLLKILSRITAPSEGCVKIRGRIGSLLEVGTGFHPELTGRENIYLNGTILGMTHGEVTRKLDEIVAFAEMSRFIDTPVKRYSSGMTVRLAFAVAAHLEPEILIVDEVLAVGDATFQKKCIGKMGEVASHGRTVLFVSHNMNVIRSLCQTGVLLHRGKVQQLGNMDQVVQSYLASSNAGREYRRSAVAGTKPHITGASLAGESDQQYEFLAVAVAVRSGLAVGVAVDFRIADGQGAAIGFGSVGTLDSSRKIKLTEGDNTLNFILDVRALVSGEYYISIDITDPGVEHFDRVNECLRIEISRRSDPRGEREIPQSWGYGSVKFGVKLAEPEHDAG